MPYDVSGLVEATSEPTATHGTLSLWSPVLCLDMFNLAGDEVSNYLFGLAKAPTRSACFPNRGIPERRTRLLDLLYEENEAFIAKHGEGDFGHTYAGLHEIDAALALPNAPPIGGSEWQAVLSTIQELQRALPRIPREQWRMTVWANW